MRVEVIIAIAQAREESNQKDKNIDHPYEYPYIMFWVVYIDRRTIQTYQ